MHAYKAGKVRQPAALGELKWKERSTEEGSEDGEREKRESCTAFLAFYVVIITIVEQRKVI